MQAMTDKTSLHSVYIIDEEGIIIIFTELKQMLALQPESHTTLIYCSFENNSIFDKELEILQKRYPTRLILYPVREKVIDISTSLQELLEAVINSNTKYRQIFILSGNEELIYIASNLLCFLGVSKSQIQIHFLG
jgi:ferredoxin-NADP reductase